MRKSCNKVKLSIKTSRTSMEKVEPFSSIETGKSGAESESRQARKSQAIERFVKMSHILEHPGADEKTVQDIKTALEGMTHEEKAIRIYENLAVYSMERRIEKDKPDKERTAPDPYFVSEFQILWSDENARRIFLEKFGETRADITGYRLSELGNQLGEIEHSIFVARDECAKLKRELNLQIVKSPTAIKAAKARLEYQRRIIQQFNDKERKIVNLEGYEHTRENTDIAAMMMYETLKRYKKESEEGFAWLPSRREIHEKINDVIAHTGKAPFLIGPPGTGKTTQVDAVARERTGVGAIRIPCHPGLSEEGLVYVRDIKAGEGAYDYEGTITEAATGYKHSLANNPVHSHGLMASLDEISQLNLERALGAIKDIRQAKVGRPFSRFAPREVLPGFLLAATSNIPIADERLDREFARIPTNYFEMTPKNPELYEFMLAKLLQDEGNLPLVAKEDLAPYYSKQDIPEERRKQLQDGSIVVAINTLVENHADVRHGFLYSFANMVRAIQDSYIHGSQFNKKHLANAAIYEDYDDKENLIIKGYITDLTDKSQTPGGQMLKLKSGSSTITAEMVSKWIGGFAESEEKDLTQWLRQMLQEHIDQASPEDAGRIQAIADYFHIFDETGVKRHAKPLTPKEIGYLSPRVPRPVYIEKPAAEDQSKEKMERKPIKEEKEYETRQVLLEDSTRILVKESEFNLGEGENATLVHFGDRFMLNGESFSFAGIVEDETSEYNGKPVGQLTSGEKLYKVFNPKELDSGIIEEFRSSLEKDLEELSREVEDQ